MTERSNPSVTDARKAKRKRDSVGSKQNAFATKKKLREDEENDSNENILNSMDANDTLDENSRKRKGKGREATTAGKKTETLENDTVPLKEEDASSFSKRRRRVRTKDSGAATMCKDSKDALVDAAAEAKEASNDKTEDAAADDVKKAVVINHKEQMNDEKAVSFNLLYLKMLQPFVRPFDSYY